MDHPLDRELELYLREELEAPRQAEVEAHLGVCSSCSGRVDRINRAALGFDAPRPGPGVVPTTTTGKASHEVPDQLRRQAASSHPLMTEVPWHQPASGPASEAAPEGVAPGDPRRRAANPHLGGGRVELVISEATRYRFLDVVGFGGVGVVYRVHDQVLDRDLAMKVLRDPFKENPDAQRRLIKEAQITGQLQHPNIVPVHELGRFRPPDQRIYFIMKLVRGQTFAAYLKDDLARRLSQDLDIFLRVCQAVAYAHEVGVIHRDLKPANVMVGAFGEVQVMDWGFAKVLARGERPPALDEEDPGDPRSTLRTGRDGWTARESRHGSVIGTVAYMAPEQARGQVDELDERTDVFGLGAILCEILTGKPPYPGGQDTALLAAASADLADARSRLDSYPDQDLAGIAVRCLSPEKSQRFANAETLAKEIQRYMTTREERIQKERAAAEEQLRRERSRRRMTLIGAVIAAVALLNGIVWKAYLDQRKLRDLKRLQMVRESVAGELGKGREYVRTGHYAEALEKLDTLSGPLQSDQRLKDLESAAHELRELATEGRREADRAWYDDFARRREVVFLNYTMFRDENTIPWASDVAGNARSALDAVGYRQGDEQWNPATEKRQTLSAEERRDIKASVLALLLVLADVESQVSPVEGHSHPVARARRPLAAATALQEEFNARAYDLIRAEVAARLGEPRGAGGSVPPARVGGRILNEYDDFLVGQMDYSRGSLESAVTNLKIAQRNQPSPRIWCTFLLAKCLLKLRRPLEAKIELDDCVKLRPDLAWSYMLRATALDGAARIYKLQARRQPKLADSLNEEARRLMEAAEADYRQALARTNVPSEQAIIHYSRHVLRLLPRDLAGRVVDLDGAARDLEDADRLTGGRYFLAYLSLAQVSQRSGHADQAEQNIVAAIRMRPASPLPYRTRAELILQKKPLTRAEEDRVLDDLEMAIQLEKADPRIKTRDLVLRAWVLLKRREYGRVPEVCEQALKLSPGDLDAHLCKIDALLNSRRYDDAGAACRQALVACRQALADEHKRAALYEVYGLVHAARKDYPAAIEAYTSALTLNPDRASLHLKRGWAYLSADSPRMARPDFEKALARGDSPAEAHCGLGTACVALELYQEALDHARAALEANAVPSSLTLYSVARIYAQAADLRGVEVAKRHLDRAQQLLVEASVRLPADDQRVFWQDIDRDPGLRALQRRRSYPEWYRQSSRRIQGGAGGIIRAMDSWPGREAPSVVEGPPARLSPEPLAKAGNEE
jgi:serine/threonine protein kinase/predicted Zn-dependent protease